VDASIAKKRVKQTSVAEGEPVAEGEAVVAEGVAEGEPVADGEPVAEGEAVVAEGVAEAEGESVVCVFFSTRFF